MGTDLLKINFCIICDWEMELGDLAGRFEYLTDQGMSRSLNLNKNKTITMALTDCFYLQSPINLQTSLSAALSQKRSYQSLFIVIWDIAHTEDVITRYSNLPAKYPNSISRSGKIQKFIFSTMSNPDFEFKSHFPTLGNFQKISFFFFFTRNSRN